MPKLKKEVLKPVLRAIHGKVLKSKNFDKEVGIPNAKSLLENHGIKIAKKSDLLAEPPSRDGYVAYCSVDNKLASKLVYFILAFLPIAISSMPTQNLR